MIESFSLKFGSNPDAESLALDVSPVTIFVGPNYSGKSKIINEIRQRCLAGHLDNPEVILKDLKFRSVPDNEIEARVASLALDPLPSELPQANSIILRNAGGTRSMVSEEVVRKVLQHPNAYEHRHDYSYLIASTRTLLLDGINRMQTVIDQPFGDLLNDSGATFQTLFKNDLLRKKLSDLVFKALNHHLVINPTTGGLLRLGLSKNPPPSAEIERGLSDASIEFHRSSTHISAASDGAKAFVGILTETLAGQPDVLLVDEPEAFLHPKLAFTLGRELAETLSTAKKQMFVATHSPHFLMGCVQSGAEINVVRLTYRDNVATARVLKNEDLVRLIRDPLLRVTGVVQALFYESAIVTEADADRAFYDEINERLLRYTDNRGIPNAIFLNAQNKHTIPAIIDPLRKLGIPTAAVYDIDFVESDGKANVKHLQSAGIPKISETSLSSLRASVFKALEAVNKEYKKNGGISLLSGPEREAAESFISQLAEYGAFVIPNGELESWLMDLNVKGKHGPQWLVEIFKCLGDEPNSADYVKPGSEDVWAFLDKIRSWLLDPQRKGIPA